LSSGTLETWCIANDAGSLGFGSGGLGYDLAEQRVASKAPSCDGWVRVLDAQQVGVGRVPGTQKEEQANSSSTSSVPTSGASNKNDSSKRASDMTREASAGIGGGETIVVPVSGAAAGVGADQHSDATATATARSGKLACGPAVCALDRERCCVSTFRASLSGPMDDDLSCRPKGEPARSAGGAGVSGASAPACVLGLECASDSDCPTEQVCCANAQAASCKPLATCTAEAGRRLACKSRAQCAQGQHCCLHGNNEMLAYSACETSCGLAAGSARICEADADCLDDTTSNACNKSALLPVVSVCWPRL
jgi:hypothetical protein